MARLRIVAVAALSALAALTACGGDSTADEAPATEPPQADDCLVRLHGKSENGAAPIEHASFLELAPSGNAADGDGRRWQYSSTEEYTEARDQVASTVNASGCQRVVLHGFSNGAAFAAKLFCRGETFDATLVGVVVDDPVPDTAVVDCASAPDVDVALYWTGGLDEMAVPDAECAPIGWICDGERLLGIDAYADELGVDVQPSVFDEHLRHSDAPEIAAWLADTPATGDAAGGERASTP